MKAFLKLAALALVVASSVDAYELSGNDSSGDGKVAVIDEKTHDVMDSEFWSTSEASLESDLSSDEMEDNDGAFSSSDELDDENWDYYRDEMDELDASAIGLEYSVYFKKGGRAKVKEVLGKSRMGELGYVGSNIRFASFYFKRGVSQQKAVKYLKGLKRRGVITTFEKVSRGGIPERCGKKCKCKRNCIKNKKTKAAKRKCKGNCSALSELEGDNFLEQ